MNTRVTYLYRDADNYKKWNSAVILGEMTEEQEERIIECLDDSEYFVPSQVGMPEEKFETETDADHPWFEWDGYEHTDASATLNISVEELVDRFIKAANGWEEKKKAQTEGMKPFVVTVQETLSRTVIIWAEDRLSAEETADDLRNDSEIELMSNDFAERKCVCCGVASQEDLNTFNEYRSNQ